MKNLYKILSFTLVILGISAFSTKAVNINVSGTISSNTTWNADTVKVTGDVTVNNGITLTISAGTYVQFQGHYKLYIQGRILAQGTATNKITFTALNTNTGWKGIKFHQTPLTNDTSLIEYCVISYGKLNVGGTYDKQGGAIFCYQFSKLIIRNNIISNNYASYYGGAISCWYNSSPRIINNLICNNTAASLGGGIFMYSNSNPNIINNTIVNNSGGSNGGGICAYYTTPTLLNCIVRGNTASTDPQIGRNNGAIVKYSNVEGGYSGTGNIDTIPYFVSPSTGVGYTYSGLTADWGLQSNSPCRNAGLDPSGYGVSMLDLAGNFRYDEGTIDIGALEYVASTQVCGTISTNTTWSGNVLITCDVLVADGKTLTIQPGTKVNFLGKYHLDIKGRLLSVGTKDSMIIFTCYNTNEGWYGIDFVSTPISNDTSKIEYCIIKNGKADGSITQDRYGGGIYIYFVSKLIIRSNIISSNWSDYYGGGIACRYSSAKIINNVIVNNTADYSYGGGIGIYGSSSYAPLITNNTIANNSSTYYGAGIYKGYTAAPVIKNNIVWGNSTPNSGVAEQIYPASGLSVQYCDIEGGTYAGTGNISSNPKFKNPSPGAGSTYKGANKDWSLQETSPCIDAGTPSTAGLELPPFDLLGKTRVYSAAVDMGAYEDKSSLSVCGTISSNTTWDANTINVSCDVVVNNQVKLTILPGVKVKFNGNYRLTIQGSLHAVGTETDTIHFTTDNPTTGWKGIYIYQPSEYYNDSTIIHNCRIENVKNNSTWISAIYVYNHDETRISNCLIKNNINTYTYSYSGGLMLRSSRALIKNNVIKNNTGGYGGGICCYASYGDEIRNNSIINNTANRNGGGIFIFSTTNTFSNNMIANNNVSYSSSSTSYGGGGIYYGGVAVSTFKNNIIVNNHANNGGGLMMQTDAKPKLFNNTIANNYAIYYGGGLLCGNNSDPILKNNILYNDSAGQVLGGNEVYLDDITSDPKLYNCLVKGGTLMFSGTGSQINYNGVYTENIDGDPLFSSPSTGAGNNYDGTSANWYIDSLSPSINKGTSDVSGLGLITTDYAGNPRINKGRIDIGAYENQEDIYAECTIASNTTWEADTIKVGCDVTVNNNVTLTIAPGTYVEFQGHYKLDIQGRLLAIGTSAEPIIFSVNDTTGFADMTSTSGNGGWDGIEFNSTPNGNDTSKIIYCEIKYGKARESYTYDCIGGGIYIYNYSKIIIANSIISNNRAYYRGGGIFIESSNPIIKNSIICNNSAEGHKTSSNNPYADGGGIYMDDASPKFYNNTVTHNFSSRYAGGIYCYNSSPVFKNNIINKNQGYYSTNTTYYRDELYLSQGTNASFYYNNIYGGKNKIIGYSNYISTYQDNIDSDTIPLFVNPPDSMGAKYDGLSANWDLLQNSPCINAGTPNLSGMNLGNEDFIGNNRLVGDTIDIGHFEIQLSNRFITTQPIAQTACLGASASFSVVIGVSSNYQWQKDGTNINGETGTTLTFSNVSLADTGNYACLFSNDFGSVISDVVSLTVQTPPLVTLNPTSKSRCLGDSVTFKVIAAGTQPITYQWQNTSGNLQGSAPMAFYTVGTANTTNTGTTYPAPYGNWYWGARHQFIIRASELSAAGITAGDMQSLAFNVTSANNCPPLDNFTLQIGLTTDSVLTSTWKSGLTAVFSATSYTPTVGWNTHAFQSPFTWDGTSNLIIETCFNNSSYLSNGNASFSLTTTTYYSTHERHIDNAIVCSSTGGSLHYKRPVVKILAGSGVSNYFINSISQNDASTYKCEASNVCGSSLSSGAVLTIKTPPSVSSLPGTYTLCETNPIPLSVTATGNPTPTYQWYKDSAIMTGYTNIQLNISAAAASDQGDYYCKATNICGDDSTNISSVIVNEEPDITSQSASSSVCEGQSLTLSATASGAQPLTYQWKKNSNPIAGATNNTYTISTISTSDAATYVCEVTNSCGYDVSNGIVITVKTAPTLSSQTSSTSVCQGSSTSFTVTASGTTPITYQWYNSSGTISSATNYSYSASAAENYYCKATNSCGNVTSNTMTLTVNTPPSITASPSNTSQCEGSGASFSVTSSGTSPITYQWYKSSSAITGATNNTYLISPVSTADAGTYYCQAINTCGNQNSSTATLTVTVAPTITSQTSSATICSGSSSTFSVTASGSGTPTYQWYNSSGAIGSATNNSYSANAAGNYYCKVTNDCGNVTSNTMVLTVNTAPTITASPTSTSQCEGSGASFSVTSSGTSPITYQWYKSSSAITGATNNTYLISPVSSSDAGTYFCKATNTCGNQNSSVATLTVTVAPTITSQTSSATICSGSSSTFSVTASGSGTPTYQWYNSSGAIGSATNNSYSATVAGSYYCKVTNACGNVTSNTMTLVVNTSPSITTQPSNVTQCVGSGVSFSVNASGTSPISYQWYKSSSAITGATSSSYLISPVASTDVGSYYCKATNTCGNAQSNAAGLTVTVAPAITAQTSSTAVCSGSSLFSITASGTPTPTYQWYNSSGAISSATNNTYSASVAGNYYCIATNNCGSSTSNTMQLTVNSSPGITTQPSNTTKCEGQSAQFSIAAGGTSPITYQWYKGSSAISGATNNSYLISPVASSDAGTYYCKATNSCGNINSNTATLTVTVAPSISTQSSSATICSGSSTLFSIAASGTPTPTYQWYKNNTVIVGATNSSYSVNTTGDYYCIATNVCGTSSSNIMALSVNAAPTITSQPANTTQCVGSGTSFNISTSGASPMTYQWYKGSTAISGATNSSYLISPVSSSDAGTYYCKATNSCGNAQSNAATLSVTVAPSITAQTNSTSVCSGSSYLFSITAGGTPTPTYQWYNANGVISSATNNTYSANTAGNYYCITTNSCGNATSNTMTMTVNTAPAISTQPSNSVKCVGQSAQFSVTASGTAPITYQWYVGSGAISGATSNSYLISPVASTDAGTYYCKATNSCGNQNSNTATLIVKSSVSLTSQSGDSTKCSGSNMNFSVTATGSAPISYQWFNNTGSIFGATSSSYSKSNVSSVDAGDYYCIATNSCGASTSTTKTLSVISLPSITSQSGNDTVCVGQSANFSITASGTQPLSYQWYNGTTAITNANNNTYTISSVSAINAGSYHCVVSNSCGNVSSTSVILLVNVPVSITSQTGDSSKCEGDNMQFGITTSGTAPITYQWYNNSGSIFGASANTYTIYSVSNTDAGSYYCVATNLCGNSQSSNKVLTVNTSPAISTQTANTTLCEGLGMTFNVIATGTAPLTYQWYKATSPITGATGSSYSISSVISSDAASYHCVVSNVCGTITGNNITLGVNSLPSITSQTSNSTKCSGQNMTFSVTATGAAPLSYQWFFDGDTIVNATNSTYNISSVDTSDIGNYYCNVTNSCGAIQSNNISLVVNEAPAITSQSGNSIKCIGQSMTFNVTATGTAPLTYQWYDNNGAITGATNNIYILTSVDTSDAGTYYCIVANSCGTAQSTSKILGVELPATITAQSSGATKCEGENMVFTVNASGTSPIMYQWYGTSGLIIGATNSSYTLNSVTSTNSGSYYCIATNSCGSDASNIAILTVNTAPDVTQQSLNTTVCEGQNVVFTNTVAGTQPITYQWYYNSVLISGATNGIFVIPSVDTSDAGYYYCKSTNVCGFDSTSNINLTVNSPILITYQSGDSSRCVGKSMTFKVQAIGTLPITYQWYDANGQIAGATNNTYLISSVTLVDAGYYYCVLTNTCGTAQSIYKTLTVHALPVVNLGNDTTFCKGGSIVISPGFGYTTLWNVGSFNPQLNVTSSGSYWCSVIDQYGCQATSDTINVNVSLPFANEQLCIVGVDSATQKNIIVWEKTPNVGVVSYNIYKETTVTGVFNLIANKDVDSLSTFIDVSSNPVAKRERYAITSIDTCANESALSPVHATIHLAVSPYQNGGWTLNWLSYNGFIPATYYIWRADVNYNWILIDSMAASSTQYNDPTAPDSCFYALEILKPGLPCVPSTSKVNTNYNSSRSNIANTFFQTLVANFNANPNSGNIPLTVQFYDETLGGPTIWSWNFGDGKAGSTQNPVHVYDSLGTFDVTLTASNATGSSSSTKFGFINVTNVGVSEFVMNSTISVYPNPYNDKTNIAYELYNEANVKIEVYNVVGERISVLVDEKQMTGNYKYQFSAQDLGHSTGLYFLRMQINDRVFTKKLIELK